jgi:sarcosine oxidase subunit gamma
MAEATVIEAPREAVAALRPASPAAHLTDRFAAAEVTGSRAVRIREVPFLSMVGLRAAPGSAAADRLSAHLGVRLPVRCGAVATGEGLSVLWLSPDEFLVVAGAPAPSPEAPRRLADDLAEALSGQPGSAVDLSANRTTFELSGPMARDVLEKGCPLDLHPRAFEIGTAYVSTIGSVPVILWKLDQDLYRLLPRASFADFLGRWLLDAMVEYQSPELPAP